jgi:outer membrane lipoprotein-sorting protein
MTGKMRLWTVYMLLALFSAMPAYAMTSAGYTLELGDFNSGGGSRSSNGYSMALDALGVTGGGVSSSSLYSLLGGGVPAAMDFYAPLGAIILDHGAPLTKYTTVGVHLGATDNTGVTGYYLSEDPTKPGAGAGGWTAVTATLSVALDTTFALSAGDGAKTVYAWFKDLAGNVSLGAGASITLDTAGTAFSITQVPGMVVSALPDGSRTSDATLNITGIVTDLSDVRAVLAGSDPLSIDPDGSFSVAVPLVPGDNIVPITLIDKAGDQTTISRTIILDPSAPPLTVTDPVDELMTARNNIDIAGSADPAAVVTVQINADGPTTATRSGGDFNAMVNLNSGINTILITASLNNGTQTAKRTVFYDFRKPGLAITGPDKDVTIVDGVVNLAGIVTDALTDVTVTVTANGVVSTPTVSTNGSFTQTLTFADEGVYPVVVTATDESANRTTVQRNVRYQRGTIVINKGAAAAMSTKVTLDLAYVSAPSTTISSMQLLYNNKAWSKPLPFANKMVITLPSGDGVKTVSVRFTDSTGAVSAFYSDTIILDSKVPVATITINNGAALTTSPGVTLSLAVSDANGVVKMQFSDDGKIWTPLEPFALRRSYTLPGTYGVKKVYARFVDSAGKISKAVSDTITYAATIVSATEADVTINNGDAYTISTSVLVAITNPDVQYNQMQTSMDGTKWTSWEAVNTSKALRLPAGDGVKTVSVQFKTAGGVLSAIYSDSIILDTIAPVGTVEINSGAYSTSDPKVTLMLTATDRNGIKEMQFSQDKANWTAWEPFAGTRSITLPAGDGVKTVQVKYKDNAGKISAACSDTILLDTAALAGTVKINNGALVISSRLVTLTFKATGATYLQLSLDNGATWAAWEPYVTSKKMTLSDGSGPKTVTVQFRDLTGNVSPAASASTTYTPAP